MAKEKAETAAERFTLRPIGFVLGGRAEPIDDRWDAVTGDDRANSRIRSRSARRARRVSHVEVVFLFHCVAETAVVDRARHPRGKTAWPKVGIFAQRGKNRPNRIGVTFAASLAVEGTRCGTPASMRSTARRCSTSSRGWQFPPRGEVHEPAWARELMRKSRD